MITDVTSVAHFREIISRNEISIVDFHADWCGPCQMMEQLILKLSESTPKVRFYKVDVDAQQDISKFVGGVHIMPTIFVYRAGATIQTMAGANPTGLQNMVQALAN